MKRLVVLAALTLAFAPLAAHAQPQPSQNVRPQNGNAQSSKAQVEVVFVLDTTGSMADLIDGAKKKIWSIVNEIATARPLPIVKIGFVACRDKGDAYVTKVVDLTKDLDKAFSTLQTFQADGGGDTPEHVSKGLHDGVHEISWGRAGTGSLYQVIFLVGDCPPHTDYNDGYDYQKHAREAAARGILINAIRCGSDLSTEPIWKTIASLGKGDYFSIAQSGGVVNVATPYDKEIGALSDKLEATTIARGGAVYAARQGASASVNGALGPEGKADRAAFNTKSAQVYGEFDIVTQQASGKADVTKMKDEDLPPAMRPMSKPQRKQYIELKIGERKKLQTRLVSLQKQRESYIRRESTKHKTADGFDVLVKKTIKRQAAKKGLKY